MLIVGAGGHAKEVLDVLHSNGVEENLYFFDDLSNDKVLSFYGYPILKSERQVENLFQSNSLYILGIGGTENRLKIVNRFSSINGVLSNVYSKNAFISKLANNNTAVDIMPFASVFANANIGKGVLINSYASVHHDCVIGEYCELGPGARILGNCKIGDRCFIGANAVILPGLQITSKVVIGAGAIVTKNINDEGVYVGNPAIKILTN